MVKLTDAFPGGIKCLPERGDFDVFCWNDLRCYWTYDKCNGI